MKATEKHKEQMKQWNKNHRENVRISQKKYYETHKDYYKQYSRTRFKDMQRRIEKAIKYIKDDLTLTDGYTIYEDGFKELLNILNGKE